MPCSDTCVITKQTYRVMKYLYHHQDVSIEKLEKKFKKCTHSDFLYLVTQGLALYQPPNGNWTNDITHTDSRGIIALVDPGLVYVENRLKFRMQWLCTTLISIASLLVAAASLAVSIFI